MIILTFLFLIFKSGTDRFFLRRAQNYGGKLKDFFYYFKIENISSLLRFYLNLYIRKVIFILTAFLPFFLCFLSLLLFLRKGNVSLTVALIGFILSLVLLILGAYYYLKLSSSLFLARYHFASGKFFSVKQIFSFSAEDMLTVRKYAFKRRLSFAGWFLSCIFILPVGFVWGRYKKSMAALAAEFL